MEFDKSRIYSAVNADELKAGDKVIVADNLMQLKSRVAKGTDIRKLSEVLIESSMRRFCTDFSYVDEDRKDACFSYALAYLVERKENCTNCRLCNRSIKDDPTQVCENYEPQVEPPTNCETCSKADTDRCPVPNPPKETGCGHWEPRPARVCENCRNLECHGKDNNWCEVREIKLSDEAIKKNTCGYLKLVKEEPKTEQKAEPHYRPFRDTDELIKVWGSRCSEGKGYVLNSLDMPHIWVRQKECSKGGLLITYFGEDEVRTDMGFLTMRKLLSDYTFADGSPCGVEE